MMPVILGRQLKAVERAAVEGEDHVLAVATEIYAMGKPKGRPLEAEPGATAAASPTKNAPAWAPNLGASSIHVAPSPTLRWDTAAAAAYPGEMPPCIVGAHPVGDAVYATGPQVYCMSVGVNSPVMSSIAVTPEAGITSP